MEAKFRKPDSSKSSHQVSTDLLERSLDTREAARALNICTKEVAELCKNGELAHHWIGNKRLFRPDDIRKFWA